MTAAVNTPSPTTTNLGNLVAEGSAVCPTVQANNETMHRTVVTGPQPPLSRTGNLQVPVEGVAVLHALDRAEEVMDMVKTWKNTVDVIKRVMNTIGPIVKVCPITFVSR